PPSISTPAARRDQELEAELRALSLEEEMYWVRGDTITGGVIVSRFPDRVEFHDRLNNRIVKIVPMPDLKQVARWCDDTSQAVGLWPDRLHEELRDVLALAGVQWMKVLRGVDPKTAADEGFPGQPSDGVEAMRRAVRWVIDEVPVQDQAMR